MAQNHLINGFFPPLLILAAATIAVLFNDRITGEWLTALLWLPYALGAIGTLIALQFSKRQLLLSILLTVANYLLIRSYLQAPITSELVRYVYTLLVLSMPLMMLCNQLVTERGLTHPNTFVLCSLALMVAGLAAAFYVLEGANIVAWLDRYFAPRSYAQMVVSVNGLLFSLTMLILSLGLCLWRKGTIQIGLFFVMLANTVPLYCLDILYISSIFATAALSIALLTGIKTSHDLAYRDQLTGLHGRRKLFERLAGLSRHYSLAMLDIDHFKKFNDTFGHDVGDDVLAMVASKIAQVGGGGEVFRYGGEEFTFIFHGMGKKEAAEYLNEIRELIANTPFIVRDRSRRKTATAEQRGKSATAGQKKVQITVSIGVSEKAQGREQAEQIIKAADKALYQAKEQGRNCVKVL